MTIKTDLQLAYEALASKARSYTQLWRYYDGDQPLRYSTERLEEVFRQLRVRFVENWCAVVVDSTMERLNLLGFEVANDKTATATLAADFQATELNLDSDDAHLSAMVTGEAFIVGWPNEAGEPEVYYNDPRLCHIQYDADNPRQKKWAAKWWVAEDGTYRLVLYYSNHLEYYLTTAQADQVTSAESFRPAPVPTAPNPYGVIPVFHLRRNRRNVQGELASVTPLQDAINKLLADMMVSAEFGAFRQRWVITNADTSMLKNAPNEVWAIPAGDSMGQGAAVGEFGQTDLSVYTGTMDKLAMSIAIITRTPKFYFYAQGGDPSGEALKTMEAPLVRKCQRYIERFTPVWREVGAFLLQLRGMSVDAMAITPTWDRVETIQPNAEAQTALVRKQVGVSRTQALRELGYSAEQIQEMDAERDSEQAEMGDTLLAQWDKGEPA